jgi:chromate transporter
LNLSFPIIVLIAAAVGYWGGKRYPENFQQSSHNNKELAHYGAAIIDDNTPTPTHAQFHLQKTLLHSAIALCCWLSPHRNTCLTIWVEDALPQYRLVLY